MAMLRARSLKIGLILSAGLLIAACGGSAPETFFITDHYAPHPWILVRLPRVERAALAMVLEQGYALVAPRRAGLRSRA